MNLASRYYKRRSNSLFMGDDSSKSIVKSLKKEWALLFEVFHQGENTEADKNSNGTRSESSPRRTRRA